MLSFAEKQLIYNLFRVLPFLQSYKGKGKRIMINGDSYFAISFPLGDLVDYLSMSKKNKRHIKKVSKMLQNFISLEPIIQTFSDIHFPSYLTSYFNQWNNKNQFYVQFEILSILT